MGTIPHHILTEHNHKYDNKLISKQFIDRFVYLSNNINHKYKIVCYSDIEFINIMDYDKYDEYLPIFLLNDFVIIGPIIRNYETCIRCFYQRVIGSYNYDLIIRNSVNFFSSKLIYKIIELLLKKRIDYFYNQIIILDSYSYESDTILNVPGCNYCGKYK